MKNILESIISESKLPYLEAKEKAWKIYSCIGHISCPFFNGESIYFTRTGFDHLIRKGRASRAKSEQKRRFALIPHVGRIIKNPHTPVIHRILNIPFWTFKEKVGEGTIKVVITQELRSRRKYFLSVMGDKRLFSEKILVINKKPPEK